MTHVLHGPGPWKKIPEMAPNGARNFFVPTNLNLAEILGRTDLDPENYYLLIF